MFALDKKVRLIWLRKRNPQLAWLQYRFPAVSGKKNKKKHSLWHPHKRKWKCSLDDLLFILFMAVDCLAVIWHVSNPVRFEIFVLCTDVQKPPPPAVSSSNGLLQTWPWMMVNLAWSVCSETVTSDWVLSSGFTKHDTHMTIHMCF